MKNKGLVYQLICFLIIVAGLTTQSFSRETENQAKLKKPGDDVASRSRMIDVNNIAMWVQPNGVLCSDPVTGRSGLYFPKGAPSDHTVIYTAGLWVLGKIAGDIRSAAACYETEFQPGMILGVGGQPDDPADQKYKVFKFTAEDWDSAEMAADRAEAIAQGMEDKMYGDQMLYCVYNDYADHSGVWGKPPIGLEVHQTTFGFDRTGALGNTIFIKYTFINKGSDVLEDAYVAQFFDPDIGGAQDDAVGCDTTLGVGYAYNMDGFDEVYGVEVPCFGCDFFQGPLVPSVGDTAYLPGQDPLPDYKVLRMTSFSPLFYIPWCGGSPLRYLESAYWYCSGLRHDGSVWLDPTKGNAVTKWPFYGDPITETGWYQALTWHGDDMRMVIASGPFTLKVGVPYTVVVGYVVGQGFDNLSSITLMKYYDKAAQSAYDFNFEPPSPPPQPEVTVAQLDRDLVLTWDTNAADYSNKGYKFEGYNVYQGETGQGPWHRVRIFDRKNGVRIIRDYHYSEELGYAREIKVAEGRDSGVQFYVELKKDWQGNRLVNGRRYYYTVTAYAYSPKDVPKVLETEKKPVVAIPQFPLLNIRYNADVGDTLAVTHTGTGEGECLPIVLDPGRLTGDEYEVSFYMGAGGNTLWKLVDLTTGEEKLTDQSHQGDDDAFLVVDGVFVKVIDSEKAPHGKGDRYTFKTKAPTVSDAIARSRLDEINVFPNPYFGFNKAETNYYRHFVTFSHLPPKCTIRIFNLSGQLVRTIVHNDGTGFERWELSNDSSPRMPVASGMYIAHIEVANVGVRVLKLAVVMPRESFILFE